MTSLHGRVPCACRLWMCVQSLKPIRHPDMRCILRSLNHVRVFLRQLKSSSYIVNQMAACHFMGHNFTYFFRASALKQHNIS